MERAKKIPLSARKKPMKKNRRLVRSIIAYLESDAYLYAPLFSNFPPLPPQIHTPPPSSSESSKADDLPVTGAEALGIESLKKNKTRMSEKVKEYLKSDCYMYRPLISPLKPGSPLKGKLQITNLVTMEVSTSSATMRENFRSDIAEHTLHSRRINSPKRAVVILEEQQTDLLPPFSSLPEEKMVKQDPRRVPIE